MTYSPASIYASCAERVTIADVKACCGGIDGVADSKILAAIDEVLWEFDQATANEFRGICSVTYRPCPAPSPCASRYLGALVDGGGSWSAWPVGLMLPPSFAEWLAAQSPFVSSWACSCDLNPCACTQIAALRLPYLPVRSVTEVRIDGAVLAAANWGLIPGTNLLVRTDGEPWPTAQNMNPNALPDAAGVWSVTETFGWELPPGAARRIAFAACQISRACSGQPCQLPEGWRIVKSGDAVAVVHDDYAEKGLTGWPTLDDWIMNRRQGRARIRPSMSRPRDRHRSSGTRGTPWPPAP